MIVWAYGGGVQTAAIAVMVRKEILPKPDLVVIADTGREKQTTWDYLHDVIQPYLAPLGITIEIASHELARCDLYETTILIPAFTNTGKLSNYCSGTWKRDVVERWMRRQGIEDCENWIGFSWDERGRCGKAHRPWCRPKYPLVEMRITRAACLSIIKAAGLPLPHKSRCWMCPHQNAEEWREIKANPEEWKKAVELDNRIRAADERGGLYLHKSRVPLETADLGQEGDEMPLFRHCQDAGCFT